MWLWLSLVADLGVFHDRTEHDAKALVALVVRYARGFGSTGVLVAASGTPAVVRPYVPPKPLHGGLVIGEHLEQLRQRQVLYSGEFGQPFVVVGCLSIQYRIVSI